MKTKIGLLILTICVVASGFFLESCKKETTETNMIIRKWNLVSKTVLGSDIITDCEKTSKWDFKSDDTYAITDSCDNLKTGTWTLAEDGKTLTLDNITAYSVIENSLIKLVIEMQINDVGLVRWTFN
ncbi:MAG: lipocalin family protein [Bacteroidales bacterium]|nr:lipocalin family protein [Bacteroidales bacterium]